MFIQQNIVKSRFLKSCLREISEELKNQGLNHVKPRFFLGSSWYTPDGSCDVFIPSYVVDIKERKKKSLSKQKVMSFLRHEIGHVVDHHYGLSEKRQWIKIFGDPKKKKYSPEYYEVDPESSDFVDHLDSFYAQSHPFEDFAETFAVWLNPNSEWEKVYKKKPGALKKLKYVEDSFSQN